MARSDIAAAVRLSDGGGGANSGPLLSILRGAWYILPAALAVACGALIMRLTTPQALDEIEGLYRTQLLIARWTAAAGLLALLTGLVALIRSRRTHHYRSLRHLAVNASGIIAGSAALPLGLLFWHGAAGFGWEHLTIPDPGTAAVESALAPSLIEASAVIVAPDRDGSAGRMAIGAGVVVHSDSSQVWIVTCSHVAMPYAAVAAWRDAERAQPVLVYLSDGRRRDGHVVWTAPPPLDVVMLLVEAEDGPAPVDMAEYSANLGPGSRVCFVPNPMRAGWIVHQGRVSRRREYATPAGTYSLLYTDLPVQPGDSGSGLFDSEGRLIGLNTWVWEGGAAPVGISLPAEAMRAIRDVITSATSM